jgi:hypothetical protein
MDQAPVKSLGAYKTKARRLEKRWQELCASYLPLLESVSIWRYHRVRDPHEPEQGWKLHISATILNAGKILDRIAPVLAAHKVQFKAPHSLYEVSRINSGLIYGYSQVGKIITVYPRTPEQAVALAETLHKLTRRMTAPVVAFDRRYSSASNIYYRFGAFTPLQMVNANGQHQLAIRTPAGELIPDLRESANATPDWVSDPFENKNRRRSCQVRHTRNPRAKNFRVLSVLVQRGKGGVYQAVDLSVSPPRLCLLKEGRKNGEVNCAGRDGSWRVRHEESVLSQLAAHGMDVPRIYTSFEIEGNYYLVTEFIQGECLHSLLCKLKRRMPIARVLQYGIKLADIFTQIHSAGWVWRDCKPLNLIVTPCGDLRPFDFEGACPVDEPDPMLWGTPGFTPPEWSDLNLQAGRHDDLYSLGSMLYLLLSGRVPDPIATVPLEKLRAGVPSKVRGLVEMLLSHSLEQRPAAAMVSRELKKALSLLEKKVTPLRPKPRGAMARIAFAGKGGRKRSRAESSVTARPAMGV